MDFLEFILLFFVISFFWFPAFWIIFFSLKGIRKTQNGRHPISQESGYKKARRFFFRGGILLLTSVFMLAGYLKGGAHLQNTQDPGVWFSIAFLTPVLFSGFALLMSSIWLYLAKACRTEINKSERKNEK